MRVNYRSLCLFLVTGVFLFGYGLVSAMTRFDGTSLTVAKGEPFDIPYSGLLCSIQISGKGISVKDGRFYADETGSADVIFSCFGKKSVCHVTVTDPHVEDVSGFPGTVFQPVLTGTSSSAVWTVDDPTMISSEENGFRILRYGSTRLCAVVDGKKLICHVESQKPSLDDLSLEVGQTVDLSVSGLSEDTPVVWSVEQSSVAELTDGNVLTGVCPGKTRVTARLDNLLLTSTVTVLEDPGFRLVYVRGLSKVPQVLRLDGYTEDCRVSWVGAEDMGQGLASFVREAAGDYPVGVTVTKGEVSRTLSVSIPVMDKFLSMEDWVGCPGDSFDLSLENGVKPVYDYDKQLLEYKDGHFRARKAGDTNVTVTDEKESFVCHVVILPAVGAHGMGSAVVDYALQFVGNPYVWGGTSLTNGTDCSGFVMRVYEHFGVSLPRTSYEQRSAGQPVASLDQALPGDLICYNGHIALYMGDGRIVHASSPKTGIKVSENASYRSIVAIRRIFE